MPILKFTEVLTYSSEDPNHPVTNLLNQDTYLKWKSEAGRNEKQEYVVLKLEKLSSVRSVDIGNEHSAFIEVLVSRDGSDFQVLLVASSFMSPLESRNSTMVNRVRMFGPDKLNKNVAEQKWDRVKIICTQPFSKTVQYGLTFIKVYEPESKDDLKKTKLGRFIMKDTSDDETDSLTIGSFFAQRQEKDTKATGPAAIRAVSKASLNLEEKPSLKRSLVESSANAPETEFYQIKKRVKKSSDSKQKGTSVPESSNIEDRNDYKNGTKNKKNIASIKEIPKADTSGNLALKKSEEIVKKQKSRPFKELMNDVVFVMSGYQNPKRSQLRDSLTSMGAEYKADWGPGCTHLICAFKNTPKYRAVKGNGKIVSEKWVEDSFKKKIKLPCKRYCLEKYKMDEDSEEEIWADEICPKEKANESKSTRKSRDLFSNNTMEDSEDTDDEIQRVLRNNDETKESKSDTKEEKGSLSKFIEGEQRLPGEIDSPSDYDYDADTDVDEPSKRKDTKTVPLPPLSSFFKKKSFFLYGSFKNNLKKALMRYIIAFQGDLCEYMSENVNFVITEQTWDENFDEALIENPSLQFVKPQWIWKCCDKEKAVPPHPYLIAPDENDQ